MSLVLFNGGLKSETLLAKILNSAAQGYKTGVAWKDNYRPGGPFDYGYNLVTRKESKLLIKAWFSGFDEGLKCQKRA